MVAGSESSVADHHLRMAGEGAPFPEVVAGEYSNHLPSVSDNRQNCPDAIQRRFLRRCPEV